MKTKTLLLIPVLCIAFICSFGQTTITVNLADKKQTILGLGAHADDAPLVDDYLNDIGISHARFFVGAKSGNDISGYVPFEEINDNADPNNLDTSKILMIPEPKASAFKKIYSKGIPVHVTIGSPPVWMKRTDTLMAWQKYNCAYPNAHDSGICGGKLRYDMYDEFAEFCEATVYRFKSQLGINLYALGLQDEPEFTELYPACVYSMAEMVNTYKAVGRRFHDKGISTRLIYGEQCFPQGNVYNWAKAANDDAELKNYISAFAVHAYSNDPMGGGMSTPAKYTELYNEAHRVSPYKEVWQSEGGPGIVDKDNSSLECAIGGAIEFYNAMYYGNSTLFMIYRTGKSEGVRYYSVKNMIRYIRPNAYRVATSCADPDVIALAFKQDSLKVTTFYIANKSNVEKKVRFSGIAGKFEVFETSDTHYCDWVGQADVSQTMTLAPMSIRTMFLCEKNKLPNIDLIDTIVVLKNSGEHTITLSGINDGGEGNQSISMSVERMRTSSNYLDSFSINYNSPGNSATLKIYPMSDKTGNTMLLLSVKDSDPGFYNEKVLQVPVFIIPYINKAPLFDSISDQAYPVSAINQLQNLVLTGVNDGNGGIQKMTLSAVCSNANVATITTSGANQIRITPKAEGTITVTITLKDNGDTFLDGVNAKIQTFKVIVGSGINGFKTEEENVSFYPNPADHLITINNPGKIYERLSITDITGRTVMTKSLLNEQEQIDISVLPKTVYILTLTNQSTTRTSRLILK